MDKLYKKIKPYFPFIFAFLGGAILHYAFAPYDFGTASIASCITLLWCLTKHSPKKAFLIGFIYGLGMFGLGVNWIYVSIHQYGDATPFLAGCITGLFIIILALFPGVLASILNRYFPRNDTIRCLLAFPALWVIFEILRGWIFTGFPWLFVGYAQMNNHLRAFAPLGSVWAVSWITVLVASLLYCIIHYYYTYQDNKKFRNTLFASLFIVWGIAFGLHKISWIQYSEDKLEIALIQGNIPQLMRWDPNLALHIVQTYEKLTQQALTKNLIIWPEGAIPVPLPLSTPFFTQMDSILKENQSALFTGVPTELNDQVHYYNSLIGIGNASGAYHKTHLVPFGEYVPFETYLRGLIGFFNLPMSSIVPGPANQGSLLAHGYKFAPLICYEIAYPIFVHEMSKNADFILTVSNDGWFGKSIGPAQHLQIAQFRALEMGEYVIRATNTGITAIISPDGDIDSTLPQFERQILTGTIYKMNGKTPWSRFGIWPLFSALLIVMSVALLLKRKK